MGVLRKPKSVDLAKKRKAIEESRRLGAEKKNELKVRSKVTKKTDKRATAVDATPCSIDEILAEEHARIVYAGAYAHMMNNQIGWDDSLS